MRKKKNRKKRIRKKTENVQKSTKFTEESGEIVGIPGQTECVLLNITEWTFNLNCRSKVWIRKTN